MTLFSHPTKGVVTASDTLTTFLAARGYEPADQPAEVAEPGELKGKALDDALRAADLPLSGNVSEKRARLEAARAANDQTPEPPADDAEREDWLVFVTGQGLEVDPGLSRNQLRDLYANREQA